VDTISIASNAGEYGGCGAHKISGRKSFPPSVGEDDRRNQVAGNDEEHVDPNEAPAERCAEMVEKNEKYGDRAKSVMSGRSCSRESR